MTVDEIRKQKRLLGYSNAQLSDYSGVPLGTVNKILSGETKSPRYDTLQALSRALDWENGAAPYSLFGTKPRDMLLRDSLPAYGKAAAERGGHTIQDLENLPAGVQMELIDGVFYDMGTPRVLHQILVGEIYRQIANALIASGKPCIALVAPTDVQLDKDEWTMVQPDIMIICKNDRLTYKEIYGSPDFVIEIISPWTRKKDYTIKPHKYQAAGVREYWILDPYQEKLLIYDFEESDIPRICGLDKDVPIGISEGEIVIRMESVRKWIEDERMKEG